MNAENRARALRMLKALARAIIEELDYDGKPIDPHTVAERALHGYPHTPEHDRDAIGREIEDYVRDILARRGGT